MVNRPFMVGPQSLLSRANSSSSAEEKRRRGRGTREGIFLGRGESPRFYSTLFFSLHAAGQGGASESKQSSAQIQTAPCRKTHNSRLVGPFSREITL